MNFVQLQYFVKAAQCLSFTEAARQLYVTQPTLSNGITKLEGSLGAKLFIRDKHSVRLTPAGEVLFGHAVQILDLCSQAANDVQRSVLSKQGLIRMGVMGDLLTLFYSDMILPFTREHKDTSIVVEQEFADVIDRNLYADNLDIILTREESISLQTNQVLDTYLIREDYFYLAVSKDHPYAHLTEVDDLSVFAKDNFIMLDPTRAGSLDERVLQMCLRRGLNPNISYSQLMDAVLVQVACGTGIAIVPGYNTYLTATPNISLIRLLPEEDTANHIILAWKKGNQSPSLKIFLEHVFRRYPLSSDGSGAFLQEGNH